jgi:CheY-like chemotaxis protein
MTTRPTSSLPITILVADDDAEDRQLAHRALQAARLANDVRFVVDGEELMDYLQQRGRYAVVGSAPRPGVILLDLRMPKKDGFACLREIRENAELRRVPVVVLTTSRAEEDVYRSYDLGVNSFIAKPVSFAGLVDAMQALGRYWFEIVELPTDVDGLRGAA